MRTKIFYFLFILCLFVTGLTGEIRGQLISSGQYELRMAPDLWYNSVDGILAGVRFRGEDPRTFLDGPHRLYAGFWLGTRFPETPVSYYISWTHPLSAISDIDSEGALHVMSSIRTGLHHHEVGMQKRHQPGFDEFVSIDYSILSGFYRRFDKDYLLYESLWQDDPIVFLRANFRKRDRNALGRWTITLKGLSGVPIGHDSGDFTGYDGGTEEMPEALGVEGLFGRLDIEALQQITLPAGFYLRSRLFGGVSSAALPPEQRYMASDASAFEWMRSGFTRARGTVPESWMRAGWVQIPGGPGLRGYSMQTTNLLENNLSAWVRHAVTFSLDFYYPNPVNIYISKIPYLGKFMRLESYLFTDAGFLYKQTTWQDIQLNAGPGFMLSLNIPDYLGQDRGFFIRYELPVWISEVAEGENSLDLRHLLGLGAHIRL